MKSKMEIPASLESLMAGLRLPLICAPMFLVSGPALVGAALRAGIVASLPAGMFRSSDEFSAALDSIEAEVARGAVWNGRVAPLSVNLTFNTLRRDPARFERDLEICRSRRVPLLITASGNPAKIVPEVHGWGGRLLHDATNMVHAKKAITAGVDGLILVCGGAGGHAGLLNPFALIPQIRRIFDGTIVLAGSVSTGGAIRAAECLGANYAYMGTRFIATRESGAPEAYKKMLVDAETSDVIYTAAPTHGVPASFLRQSLEAAGWTDENNQVASDKKAWRDIWSGGHGVGLIDDVPTVSDLVERLEAEYRSTSAPNC